MSLKNLIFKILGILLIFVMLYMGFLYFSLKTKVKDVSNIMPFKSIIGTEQLTKQICYLALNQEPFRKENPYLLQIENNFNDVAETAFQIPIGTRIKIENVKAFTNGVSGFTSHYVLGHIYVNQLEKEVAFEYLWDGEKPLEIKNHEDYLRYPLTPWQDVPLPYKYSIENNSKSAYQWPSITSNTQFNELLKKIWVTNIFNGNRDFENTTFNKSNYKVGMNYFAEPFYLISDEHLPLLQLNHIYPDFYDNSTYYVIGNDHRINLSEDFISIVLTVLLDEFTMESVLINYDLHGKYLDHLLLSKADKTDLSLIHISEPTRPY